MKSFSGLLVVFLFLLHSPLAIAEATADLSKPKSIGISEEALARLERFESNQLVKQPQIFYRNTSDTWEKIAKDLKLVIESPANKLSDALEDDQRDASKGLDRWHLDINNRFALLKRAGAQRARALNKLESNGVSLFEAEDHLIDRVILEITLIPYTLRAYFHEKSYWVLQNLNQGFWGIFNLVKELLLFLFLVLLPFIFVSFSSRLNKFLEKKKQKSFYQSFRSQWHRNVTLTISVVSVYIPWIFALMALSVVGKTLSVSQFEEVSYLLPYIYYYIYYKIFRSTLELGLQEFASNFSVTEGDSINTKIKATSKTLGLFLLYIYSLETAIHSVIGDSLIFSIIEPLFGYMVFALLLFISSEWQKEVQKYLYGTNLVYYKKVADFMRGYWVYPLSLIGLVLIFAHYVVGKLIFWSSQFDFVKLVYAKVLRVKFETSRSHTKDSGPISEEYARFFKEENTYTPMEEVVFTTPFFAEIKSCFDEWCEEAGGENTVGIYGGRGSGKSTFLHQYSKKIEIEGRRVLNVSVPPKVFTEKSFEALFEDVISYEPVDPEDRICVFVDNAHNLFLATIGGFQIYNQFLELMERNKNIFWIVGFNDYSWQFLNSVLGVNQYFRLELRLPKWNVDDIKELILTDHNRSGYKLDYDQIFKSSQKLQEGISSAESRYFYLLWERCGGNPGLAVTYWLRSLRRQTEKSFMVSLPVDNDSSVLSSLHQDMHFVYASVIKHGNLNASEASRATNIPRPVVRQALIRGIEEGFLEIEDGRYRVSMNWIDDVKRYLRGKNLIYESN